MRTRPEVGDEIWARMTKSQSPANRPTPKADVIALIGYFRLWHKADMQIAGQRVRFRLRQELQPWRR
jgi:hypothetical protein